MKISETDPDFDNNLKSQTYSRKAIITSLMRQIEAAADINWLKRTSVCGRSSAHFVYNDVCKLYFKPLEGNRVRLINFTFAGHDEDESDAPQS